MAETEVIRLRLGRVEDMFQTPEWDASSFSGGFEPGIDVCVSELLSRRARSRSPVRVDVELPTPPVDPDSPTRLREAIGRYCEDRMNHNDRQRLITRRDGYAALKIGIPIALVGLVLAVATAVAQTDTDYTLPNLAGWVLAWVGLWYPLDTIAFGSVVPRRENAALARLRVAEVRVTAP
jgi:hypothetical protein